MNALLQSPDLPEADAPPARKLMTAYCNSEPYTIVVNGYEVEARRYFTHGRNVRAANRYELDRGYLRKTHATWTPVEHWIGDDGQVHHSSGAKKPFPARVGKRSVVGVFLTIGPNGDRRMSCDVLCGSCNRVDRLPVNKWRDRVRDAIRNGHGADAACKRCAKDAIRNGKNPMGARRVKDIHAIWAPIDPVAARRR